MLIYSIAECTFVVVFSQHSGEMPVSLLLVGHHMLSYSILHDKIQKSKVNLTSPNEENSSRLVMDVSGLETSKKMSDLAFVSKCQDFYTKALDDILYIYFHHFQNVLNKCSKMC